MRTGAVDELAAGRVVLLIGHDQRQQGDRLAGARRHLQHAISAGIERLCGRLARGRAIRRRPPSAPRPYSSSPPCSCRATPFHVSMIGSAGPRVPRVVMTYAYCSGNASAGRHTAFSGTVPAWVYARIGKENRQVAVATPSATAGQSQDTLGDEKETTEVAVSSSLLDVELHVGRPRQRRRERERETADD